LWRKKKFNNFMMKNRKAYLVLIMLICAFLMSCVFIFLIKPYPGQDYGVYQRLGLNLSIGNGYSSDTVAPFRPVGWRTPLYPVFLAIIYKIFGLNNTVVFLFQGILYTLTTLFLFLIVKILFSEKTAFLAGFLFALLPISAYWVGVLYTETLVTFLLVLVTFFMLKYTKTKEGIYFWLACILMGLCILDRPIYALYPLLVILCLAFFRFTLIQIILHLLIGSIIILFTLSPWIIRNYFVYKEFVPLTKGLGAGHQVYMATFEFRNGWDNTQYGNDPLFLKQAQELRSKGYISEGYPEDTLSYINADKIFYQYAFKNIRSEPLRYFSGYFKRFIRLYVGMFNPAFNHLVIFLNIIFSSVILILSMVGIWLLRKDFNRIILILSPIIYVTFIHLPLLGISRYTVPVRPYMAIFVAIAVIKICGGLNLFKNYGKA